MLLSTENSSISLGFLVFLKKKCEKISRTLTNLERVNNGVPITRIKTVGETQRKIAEGSIKLDARQLTVKDFITR